MGHEARAKEQARIIAETLQATALNPANVNFGRKMIDCLEVAELFKGMLTPDFEMRYQQACQRWSEKAVNRKLAELEQRGYLTNGRLTLMGRQALEADRLAAAMAMQDRRENPDVPQPDGRRRTDQQESAA
jgi:hypothetical protein